MAGKRINLLLIFLFSAGMSCFAQSGNNTSDTATFITRFDKANATKDGYYLDGYVVEISDSLAQKLDKKTIRVSGKISVVNGLNHTPKEYDKNGNEIIMQGRAEDCKHIYDPLIEIIK